MEKDDIIKQQEEHDKRKKIIQKQKLINDYGLKIFETTAEMEYKVKLDDDGHILNPLTDEKIDEICNILGIDDLKMNECTLAITDADDIQKAAKTKTNRFLAHFVKAKGKEVMLLSWVAEYNTPDKHILEFTDNSVKGCEKINELLVKHLGDLAGFTEFVEKQR